MSADGMAAIQQWKALGRLADLMDHACSYYYLLCPSVCVFSAQKGGPLQMRWNKPQNKKEHIFP